MVEVGVVIHDPALRGQSSMDAIAREVKVSVSRHNLSNTGNGC